MQPNLAFFKSLKKLSLFGSYKRKGDLKQLAGETKEKQEQKGGG